MGPFQEYEEKKSQSEKGSPRTSRIPRLVLHPFRPKDQGSPLSESPGSEEEGKDQEMSDHSKSYCSDDTGCPTSQSVSPSKTLPGSENSPQSPHSPVLPERKTKVKRVRMMPEWNTERTTPRYKREHRSAMKSRAKGSEADFSSSSSSGSLKTRESLASMSTGKKNPSRSSRGAYTRPVPVFKPPGSPKPNRDASLYAPYRTPPRTPPSTNSSSNSSPTSRRVSRYHSCGDNHGIRPPNPEQYLTPLQQKEVAIRHLKIKLMESENRVHDREADIEEMKSQLGRMREDWIEEECHRVEAQLSLKEARKEIKQLRQVVETMKSSLMEKDKGIQKYFVDINIQNRKLESLLQSMELSQSGSNLHDEPTEDFNCDSTEMCPDGGGKSKMVGEEEGGMELGDQAAEAMADSGLLVNDEMANRADILEQVFMSTAVDFSQDSGSNLRQLPGPRVSTLLEEDVEKSDNHPPPAPICSTFATCPSPPHPSFVDQSVQADVVSISPLDLQALLLQLLKLNGGMMAPNSVPGLPDLQAPILNSTHTAVHLDDSTPTLSVLPTPAPPKSPDTSTDSGMCCSEPAESRRFMEELDFTVGDEPSCVKVQPCVPPGLGVVSKRHWSNSFLVDLVAVAAPVLPTVAWLYSRHGVDGSAPVYNIAALIRGCCIMGLHSLRHVTRRPDV